MKWKQIVLVVAVSAVSAVSSVWIYGKFNNNSRTLSQTNSTNIPANYAGYFDNIAAGAEPIDFTKAANAAVPAVVHIKTKTPAKTTNNQLPRNRNSMEDWFDQFFNFD